MKRLVLLAAVAACGVHAAEPNLDNGKLQAETICIACHASDGNSAISIYPRIAGQHQAYTAKQVKDIRDGTRAWGDLVATMVPMVETLSDQDIIDVSAYYAKQTPLSGEADPATVESGRAIYRAGIAAAKVPACIACHGPTGSGIPAASAARDGVIAFPRITGQHKDYIVEQMKAFRDGVRTHAMMEPISTRLSDQQIDDVANYIQGLH